ncbi:hypothetical protein EBU94_04495, partial [bacterium]|nr:hypothetical protein [bacterium]
MIENLLRKSLEIIKGVTPIPTSGFLAGGSLQTISWNLLHNQNVPINDVDVFNYSPISETEGKTIETETEKNIDEDIYGDIVISVEKKIVYKICSVKQEGILNLVDYQSNFPTVEGLISRFDINSTQVGYDISSDKFFWTKDFEEFLINKKLYVSTIITPVKTLSRIYKKSKEFSIPIERCEIDILNMSINLSSDKID